MLEVMRLYCAFCGANHPSGEALAAGSFKRDTWYQQQTKEPGR
jgi:hypothetical protein